MSVVPLPGFSLGESVTLIFDGVMVSVSTFAGQSEEDVVASFAAAINSSEPLNDRGTSASADGGQLILYGQDAEVEVSGPGLPARPQVEVPTLGPLAMAIVVLSLARLAARSRQ